MEGEVSSLIANKRMNPSTFSEAMKRQKVHSDVHSFADGNGRKNSLPYMDAGALPDDFLQPLDEIHVGSNTSAQMTVAPPQLAVSADRKLPAKKIGRQFWKAGDYESDKVSRKVVGGMDRVRVHPKFLHSNATSHKWALGAIAELLDNALDEAVHGATFAKVDVIRNPKSNDPMLVIEDDGGGMHPDSMRQCMSLGYSAKTKIANTIGQYGNGFKTSTMRLGADVIVFSRCQGASGSGPSQSIGMLSYTFLRETGQQDIIVPMIDYEIHPFGLRKLVRRNVEDWSKNMESIQRWSPYSTETELLSQFSEMKSQGTKIVIFNLWEDDQGQLELDFETNRYDIQVRSNRDEKKILMVEKYPHSRHYLTYQHSLRIYASILYLKLPPGFRMFLRGKEIEHHNIIDDLMLTHVSTYRPQVTPDMQKDIGQAKAVVTIGFVKDAEEHIDVQGFNVYHKNRLIKPFWRLWNPSASRGRGIIGVLEANFVEPAHDKQGFERTIVLARLEAKLIEMQKSYWSKNCHEVGYVNNSLKFPPLQVEVNPNLNPNQWNLSSSSQPTDQLRAYQVHRPSNVCLPPVGPYRIPLSGLGSISTHRIQENLLPLAQHSAAPQVETTHLPGFLNHHSPRIPSDKTPVHTTTVSQEQVGSTDSGFSQVGLTVEQCIVDGETLQDQSQAKVTKLSSKAPVLIKKSLEDLGRMFVKKGASITVNEDLAVVDPKVGKVIEEELIEARGECVTDSRLSIRELEACLVGMESEIQNLQEKLDEVKAERDQVRQQLVEERVNSQVTREDLHLKVEQTWAKVRELEAQNISLRLAHGNEDVKSFRILEPLK